MVPKCALCVAGSSGGRTHLVLVRTLFRALSTLFHVVYPLFVGATRSLYLVHRETVAIV
jgi:hypothetical protein